jgi:ornithine cyclodeaminase/alanine dehydrogenase-like protein (mu-crystallin family)
VKIEVVPERAVKQIVSLDLVYHAVRDAFLAVNEHEIGRFPVFAASSAQLGTAVNIKFGHGGVAGGLGLKVGTFWPENKAIGLPNHCATILLLDQATGMPTALISASLLNRFRTAAADAVAVSALAAPDATILAVIGAGRQAPYEARAIAEVRSIQEIRIGVRDAGSARNLLEELQPLAKKVGVFDIRTAVQDADIIVTATSASNPVLKGQWVKPSAHISAMGTDRVGKRELDASLSETALFFADDPVQSRAIGEGQYRAANNPIRAIGSILIGNNAANRPIDCISVFDSSGLAIQDLTVAQAVLSAARGAGLVTHLEF